MADRYQEHLQRVRAAMLENEPDALNYLKALLDLACDHHVEGEDLLLDDAMGWATDIIEPENVPFQDDDAQEVA